MINRGLKAKERRQGRRLAALKHAAALAVIKADRRRHQNMIDMLRCYGEHRVLTRKRSKRSRLGDRPMCNEVPF